MTLFLQRQLEHLLGADHLLRYNVAWHDLTTVVPCKGCLGWVKQISWGSATLAALSSTVSYSEGRSVFLLISAAD